MHWEKGGNLLAQRYEDEPLTGLLFDCLELLACSVSDVEVNMTLKRKAG